MSHSGTPACRAASASIAVPRCRLRRRQHHIAGEVHHGYLLGTYIVFPNGSASAAPWPPSGDRGLSGNRGRSSLRDPPRRGARHVIEGQLRTARICGWRSSNNPLGRRSYPALAGWPRPPRRNGLNNTAPGPARPPPEIGSGALSPASASAESSSAIFTMTATSPTIAYGGRGDCSPYCLH